MEFFRIPRTYIDNDAFGTVFSKVINMRIFFVYTIKLTQMMSYDGILCFVMKTYSL